MTSWRRWTSLGALLVLTACGGGGGGGATFGPALFAGSYDVAVMSYLATLDGESEVSLLDVDGVGNGNTSDGIENDDGNITVATPSTLAFTVDGVGNVVITDPAFPTLPVEGGITSDGRCLLFGANIPSANPGFLAMLRHGSGFSNASLNLGYHVGYFFGSATGIGAGWGSATMNGDGTWSLDSFDENDDGVVSSGTPALAQTYTVLPSGRTTMSFGLFDLRGMLAGGGAFAILAGDVTPVGGAGEEPIIVVLVRKGSGLGNGTFSGSYWMTGGGLGLGGGVTRSYFGTADTNGAGGLTLDVKLNEDGTITDPAADAGNTYVVGADGTLTVTLASGNVLLGGVTSDGRFGFAAGGTVNPSDVDFILFCRKN